MAMPTEMEIKVRARAEGAEDVSGLNKTLRQTAEELTGLTRKAEDVEAYKKLGIHYRELALTLKEAEIEVVDIGDRLGENSAQYEMAQAKVEKLTRRIDENVSAWSQLGGSLKARGVDIRNLDTEQERLQQGLAETSSALVELKRHNEAYAAVGVRPFRDIQAEIAHLNASYKRLSESISANSLATSSELARVTAGYKAKMSELKAEAGDMSAKIKSAWSAFGVRPIEEVRTEIGRLTQSYNLLKESGSLSFIEMQKVTRNYKAQIAGLQNEYSGWHGSLSKIQTGFIAVAGAAYTASRAVGSYLEFSKEMANVSTIVEESREKFEAFTRQIEGLSGRFPQSAKEFASAAYDVLSSGVKIEQTVQVLDQSAKAAAAGVTDVKTAAAAGVGVINAYGMQIDRLGNIFDIMFQTVKDGVTTFPELSQHIGQVLPTAKAAGVEFKDVAGSIAAMTKAGIRTPEAATALKGAITAMAAPAPEAKKVFEALGVTWQGLIPTLEKIRSLGLSLDQMRLLIPDVEARTAVMSLTQNMDSLKETMKGINDSAGATEEAWEKIKDTPAYQIDQFKKEIEGLVNTVGEKLVPVLLEGIGVLKCYGEAFALAGAPTHYLAGALVGVAGAAAAWNFILSPVITGLWNFVTKIRLVLVALPDLATALTLVGQAAVIVWGVAEAYTAIKAFMEMREAAKSLAEAQQNLIKQSESMKEKFREFADVKIPEKIYEKPLAELEELRNALLKTRAYNQAMIAQLSVKSQETSFGFLTEDAKKAIAEMARLEQKQKDINTALGEAKAAIADKSKTTEAETAKEIDAVSKYRAEIEKGTLSVSTQMAVLAKNGGLATGYYADMAKAEAEVHRQRLDNLDMAAAATKERLKNQVYEIELAEAQGIKSRQTAAQEKSEIEKKHLAQDLELLKKRLSEAEKVANAEAALNGKASDEILKAKQSLEKEITANQDAQAKARIKAAESESAEKKKIFEKELKERYTDELDKLKDVLEKRKLEIDLAAAQELKTKKEAEEEKASLEKEFIEKSIGLAKDRLRAIEDEIQAEVRARGQADDSVLASRKAAEKALNDLLKEEAKNRVKIAELEASERKEALEKEAEASEKSAEATDKETEAVEKNAEAKKENTKATGDNAEKKKEVIKVSVSVRDAQEQEEMTLSKLNSSIEMYQSLMRLKIKPYGIGAEIESLKAARQEYDNLIEAAKQYGWELDASNMTLEEAKAKVEELKTAWMELSEQIAQVQRDTDQAIREMNRRNMTPEEVHADMQAEYNEKMAEAQRLVSEQNYEAASKMYLEAQRVAENLAEEVRSVSGATIMSLEETTSAAADLMRKASAGAVEAIRLQRDELGKLKEAADSISSGNKNSTWMVGPKLGFSSGGKLPGFGWADTVPAMLTPGERITNAYSTRLWDSLYPGLMDAINGTRSEADARRIAGAFALGPVFKFNTGGIVPDWNFNIPSLPSLPTSGGSAVSPSKIVEVRVVDAEGTSSLKGSEAGAEMFLRQIKRARMVS